MLYTMYVPNKNKMQAFNYYFFNRIGSDLLNRKLIEISIRKSIGLINLEIAIGKLNWAIEFFLIFMNFIMIL